MMIQRLVLDQVACFEHAEIDFPAGRDSKKADIHILVGPNGSGKSTALMALAQFFTTEPTGLELRLQSRQSRATLTTRSRELAVIGMYAGPDPQRIVSAPGGRATIVQQRDHVAWYAQAVNKPLSELRRLSKGYRPSLPQYRDSTFAFAAFAYSGQRSVASYSLVGIQEQDHPPLHGACNFSSADDPKKLVQWIANMKAKEAFAIAKGDESKARHHRDAIARIEKVVNDIIGKSFSFDFNDDPLRVSAVLDGQQVELDVLPDGLKSIIGWVADLLMRMDWIPWEDDTPVLERPFVLFLDEIEIHLHPAWQRRVLPTVQDLFPNAQIIMSTHSPFIIASADDAWIHPLHLGDHGTVVGEPLRSMVGNSYSTVLRDVLGIEAEFAPQVEGLLDEFYALRDQALQGDAEALAQMRIKLDNLRQFGEEVLAVVLPELKQVERHLARNG